MAHTLRKRSSRNRQRAWYAIAGAFFLVAVMVLGWLGWFYWHSKTGGARLLHSYQAQLRTPARLSHDTSCSSTLAPPTGVAGVDGILSIPSLGVKAPVENGASTTVLSDAVGHDPASAWPNSAGTSVLFAHDVTWFSGIDGLAPGSKVVFQDSCWTYTYAVVSHRVVPEATELLTQAQPTVYLVTCWPSDALYYTPDRYVIQAKLVGESRSPQGGLTPVSPLVGTLHAQGATAEDSLSNNPTPMGYLSILGNPSNAFKESAEALDDVGLALDEFFLRERQAQLPSIAKVIRGLDVTLEVNGNELATATVSDVVMFSNGSSSTLTVNERVLGNALTSNSLANTVFHDNA